jgi:SAM-dependent methyltransferase
MPSTDTGLRCRLCTDPLGRPVWDLGAAPLANGYRRPEQLAEQEPHYPLRLYLCERCTLLQLEAVATPERIFREYAYFSSYSTTLLRHSQDFARSAIDRLGLTADDLVLEAASNDGYLLQYFHEQGIPVLGIEPAANVAAAAAARGIPTIPQFFGLETAREVAARGRLPRLIVANNVVAHVPDPNDFIAGIQTLLAPDGIASLEFHYLLRLVGEGQFDTIYHEHFQYFSLRSISTALAAHRLSVVDVQELPTQGGSLRVYARHASVAAPPSAAVTALLAREQAAGLADPATYRPLAHRAERLKTDLLCFLHGARQSGKSVVCFGAAAKGSALLSYCGVKADLVDYALDSNPHKRGLLLPGVNVPIHGPERAEQTRPDYVLILPWNLRDEVMQQMAHIRRWGGHFVVPAPELRVL